MKIPTEAIPEIRRRCEERSAAIGVDLCDDLAEARAEVERLQEALREIRAHALRPTWSPWSELLSIKRRAAKALGEEG